MLQRFALKLKLTVNSVKKTPCAGLGDGRKTCSHHSPAGLPAETDTLEQKEKGPAARRKTNLSAAPWALRSL